MRLISSNNEKKLNWLFLAGGPGLGSESLANLVELLTLPGNLWYLDLPGDGSNNSDQWDFSNWQQGLIEATQQVDNVILVAHSSGGMFALATAGLEANLTGLVLMDSAPHTGWQQYFIEYVEKHPLPGIAPLQQRYQESPSNDLLKELTIACLPYFSKAESREKMEAMLKTLSFNHKSHLWSESNFDQTYEAKWVPQAIPTLIFAGEQDNLTPLKLFSESVDFQRDNILIREIAAASHYPWFDNPEQIKQVFAEFCQTMAFE
ncbi:acetoin dehydrogenase E2 subunit dihydrolipoyllysine-residue acetyltransferase [Legionella massiliensis]|uniref:Acetoin dehydrogenase E2 subunit dihydrolipoyllysine-residue acetyltransferase n=1 Tax=Legionella massiliensis TaxID=1034943 RepID=A0A078KSY2_9GAMM|nr:alpha/beta hydrolase [Legionella massiliensis]CDZ76062.1 acetoin dehydrogenase E2 subunit dihydrolipoyllysine-residue acetyltransferase [Legionella massiliensis]CEE11800.1 Alpha/beta hydrolase family protein [Legionella massiliensis]